MRVCGCALVIDNVIRTAGGGAVASCINPVWLRGVSTCRGGCGRRRASVEDVGVDRRGGEVLVAHEFVNGADVLAVLQ